MELLARKSWFVVLLACSVQVEAIDDEFYSVHETTKVVQDANSYREVTSDQFYLCYPKHWDGSDIAWYEFQHNLQKTGAPLNTNVHAYQARDVIDSLTQSAYFKAIGTLDCAEPLLKMRVAKKSINDTYFADQWILENTGQGGNPGEDISATEAWGMATGAGVVIGIMDDGLEIRHPDLMGNAASGLSWDFVQNDQDPTASEHGTAVAGVAAAVGNNGIGVGGVAYDAGLAGLRVLDDNDYIVETDVAAAIQHQLQGIDILNSSWGPPDGDYGAFTAPTPLINGAFETAINEGRNGRGRVIVWAAGNGGSNDSSNLDGYANSRYTVAVAASTDQGVASTYSESGANILITAPSSGGLYAVSTTDRSGTLGYNDGLASWDYLDTRYTNRFGGTSSATPVVSGVVALMLEVNPALGWRDVQAILAASADKIDPYHGDWKLNGAGYTINEQYGFGRVNAAKAVELAATWGVNMQPETSTKKYFKFVNQTIPDNNPAGLSSSFQVDENLRVQHVEVTVDIPDHSYWGDLEMELTSPSGTTTKLVHKRVFDTSGTDSLGYFGWKLTDVLHNGEHAKGMWTLKVLDTANLDIGTLSSWGLKVFGTEIPMYATELPYKCNGIKASGSGLAPSPIFYFGASTHGSFFTRYLAQPTLSDLNISYGVVGLQEGDGFLVAVYYKAENTTVDGTWFTYNGQGWQLWGGALDGLPDYINNELSQGMSSVLYNGHLPAGTYAIYYGIRKASGDIYYCPTPTQLLLH